MPFSGALAGILPEHGWLSVLLKVLLGLFVTVPMILGFLHKFDKPLWTKVEKDHVGIRTWKEVEVRVKAWHKFVFFWRERLAVGSVSTTGPGRPISMPFKGGVHPLSLRDRSTDVDKVLHFWEGQQHYAGGSFIWTVIRDPECYVLAWSKGEDLTKQVSDILNRAFSQALPFLSPLEVADPVKMKEAVLPFCEEDLAGLGVELVQANTIPQGYAVPYAILHSGADLGAISGGVQDVIPSSDGTIAAA